MTTVFVLLIVNKIVSGLEDRLSFFGDSLETKDEKSIHDDPLVYAHSHRRLLSNIDQNIQLQLSPSALNTPNGFEIIEIHWSGANVSRSDDFIGIYSPPDSLDIDYLDYFDTHGASSGTRQYQIWNMRADYQVRYVSGLKVIGRSSIVTVIPHQPLQGHLSLTKNSPNEMQLRWNSALISHPIAKIGTASQQYTRSFSASSYTYDTSKMCGDEASKISAKQFRDPGYMHTVIFDNLQLDTKYFYVFGNEQYLSDEQSFTTSSGDKSETFSFIAYGDMGTTEDGFKFIDSVKKDMDNDDESRLVLHIGDLSYARGNGYNWDKWMNMISPVAMSVPYMVSIGNHEYDHLNAVNDGGLDVSGVGGNGYHPKWGNMNEDGRGECGAPSFYRFDADICENGNSIFWYSFNYNSVHIIMLSSEHDYSQNTEARRFLLNDLKSVDRDQTPWIIVGIHRPLYQSEIYPEDNRVDAEMLKLLEPLFHEYNVNIVIGGHYHSYERTCPVYNYECVGRENGGTVYFTMGAAGWLLDNGQYTPNNYVLYRNEEDFGYGKFTVNDAMIRIQYVTLENGIIDEIVLHQDISQDEIFTDKRKLDELEPLIIGSSVVIGLCVIVLAFRYKLSEESIRYHEALCDADEVIEDFGFEQEEEEEEELKKKQEDSTQNQDPS